MEAGTTGAARGTAHDVGEARRRADGLSLPLPRDRPRDAARGGFLAVLVDEVGEVALGEAVHEVLRRRAGGAVEAHVERALGLEAEAALRVVELDGGDAEVEEDAPRPLAAEVARDLAEVGVNEPRAVAERGEPLPRARERLRVAVGAEEPAVR